VAQSLRRIQTEKRSFKVLLSCALSLHPEHLDEPDDEESDAFKDASLVREGFV